MSFFLWSFTFVFTCFVKLNEVAGSSFVRAIARVGRLLWSNACVRWVCCSVKWQIVSYTGDSFPFWYAWVVKVKVVVIWNNKASQWLKMLTLSVHILLFFCNKIQTLAHAKNSKFNYSHNYFAVWQILSNFGNTIKIPQRCSNTSIQINGYFGY